jgi:hypothetical protein
MSENEFTKLFKYMTERFDKVDKQFSKMSERFDGLEKLVDKVLKNQEIDDEERLVMGHQLDRLDRWVHEIAEKIGYKLTV